ncbi:hypothetical protein [Streptomyces sp. NPDC004721]
MKKIQELGFDGTAFDDYDQRMTVQFGSGRDRPLWAERLGKKYQWIALAYLAALIADHFKRTGPSALLVRQEWLNQRLSKIGKRLVWTALGEQQETSGDFDSSGHGYTVHSRAHQLWGDKIHSSAPIVHRPRPAQDDRFPAAVPHPHERR